VGLFNATFALLARTPWVGTAVRRYALRATYPARDGRAQRPRDWSNDELRKIAPFVSGDMINVSGWQDSDKRGRRYRDYFPYVRNYTLSNYEGARGLQGANGEITLDLESKLPQELAGRFDVVFNHTVLEHVFDVHQAVETLCALSRDIVITVTPFSQEVHFIEGSYGDWWRMTPACMRRLLERQGFSTIYQSVNETTSTEIYVFTVAARDAQSYRGPRASVTDLGIGSGVLRPR
jgi:hypothetical protein